MARLNSLEFSRSFGIDFERYNTDKLSSMTKRWLKVMQIEISSYIRYSDIRMSLESSKGMKCDRS